MSDGGKPPVDPTGLRRVDERLGLAVCRASLSGRTLVTYARDHVSVRTPSRPDFYDGNTIDLLHVPAGDEFDEWVQRFRDTIGVLGAEHVQVRWEQPPPEDGEGVTPAPMLADAARRHGLRLDPVLVLLLDRLRPPPPAPGTIAPVPPPSVVDPQPTDRRWHASTVLYRYDAEDTGDPETWRAWDEEFVAWSVDVQRELAGAERAQVWVAQRHGAPVARATLVHDRQGLAVVEDVIVHPVHRRRGIAAALTHAAVAGHLAVESDARVGLGAAPGSSAERLYRRLGFVPHATVWTARGTGSRARAG